MRREALDIWDQKFCSSRAILYATSRLRIGIALSAALPFITRASLKLKSLEASAYALSEISYTLYLSHFPILSFIVFVGLAPTQYLPGLMTAAFFALLAALSITFSAALWWCFERNTNRIHRALFAKLISKSQHFGEAQNIAYER